MSKLWFEGFLLGLAIVLCMIILSVFKLSGETFSILESYDSSSADIEYSTLINIDKSDVYGSDVIAFIRFFKDESGVNVTVINTGGTKQYINTDFDYSSFPIAYNDTYSVVYEYTGDVLNKIICTLN